MSRQAIYLAVRQLIIDALGPKTGNRSPYAIRRGIIVSLLESGKRIEDIGRFMAWRNPLMATVYDKRSQLEVSKQFINI
jgi:hypothetical protein